MTSPANPIPRLEWRIGAAKVLVYFMLALTCATLQHRLRETYAPYAGSRYDTVSVAEGRSKPPIQRRILVPLAAVNLSRVSHIPLPQVELAIRTFSLTAVFFGLELVLAGLGFRKTAVVGPLLLACLLPLGFYVNPVVDSYPAMAVLGLGLFCLQRRRGWWTLPLILVGASIRESVVLIPAVFFLTSFRKRPVRDWFPLLAAQLGCYLIAQLVLRWLYPGPSFDWTLPFNWNWVRNAGAAEAGLRLLVLGLPFVLAWLGMRKLSGLGRAMGWAGFGYGAGLMLVARLSEPRVFWDAYLLLTPAMVNCLVPVLNSSQD